METTAAYARPELLQVADTVARDKGIDKDEVLEAMEQAIQKAGRSKYGQEYDIRAEIDRRNGEIRLLRFREVAEAIENEATQIGLVEAQRLNPEAEIGDFITDPLPPIDFGRIAAQTAKQVIVQKVRDAERQRQFLEFKDRVGEIVNGLVKRVEFGNVVVDLGRAEAMLRRDELLPRESFRQGERVRAYIYDVREETRGPQIFLSRTHPQFMAKLFAQEVPEIYDGIIEIKAVAGALHLPPPAGGPAGRRSSCRARIRISWPSCSRGRCRKSTTASSRSGRSPAPPAAALRLRLSRATAASPRSAPASACAAA